MEQLVPRATEILNEKAKVKRSSKGIINASTIDRIRFPAPKGRGGLADTKNKPRYTVVTRATEWQGPLSHSFEPKKTENATKDDEDSVFTHKQTLSHCLQKQTAAINNVKSLLEIYHGEIRKLLYDQE